MGTNGEFRMDGILTALKIMLKKDNDLPWVTRLLRWGLSLCILAYAVNFVALSIRNGWFQQ